MSNATVAPAQPFAPYWRCRSCRNTNNPRVPLCAVCGANAALCTPSETNPLMSPPSPQRAEQLFNHAVAQHDAVVRALQRERDEAVQALRDAADAGERAAVDRRALTERLESASTRATLLDVEVRTLRVAQEEERQQHRRKVAEYADEIAALSADAERRRSGSTNSSPAATGAERKELLVQVAELEAEVARLRALCSEKDAGNASGARAQVSAVLGAAAVARETDFAERLATTAAAKADAERRATTAEDAAAAAQRERDQALQDARLSSELVAERAAEYSRLVTELDAARQHEVRLQQQLDSVRDDLDAARALASLAQPTPSLTPREQQAAPVTADPEAEAAGQAGPSSAAAGDDAPKAQGAQEGQEELAALREKAEGQAERIDRLEQQLDDADDKNKELKKAHLEADSTNRAEIRQLRSQLAKATEDFDNGRSACDDMGHALNNALAELAAREEECSDSPMQENWVVRAPNALQLA